MRKMFKCVNKKTGKTTGYGVAEYQTVITGYDSNNNPIYSNQYVGSSTLTRAATTPVTPLRPAARRELRRPRALAPTHVSRSRLRLRLRREPPVAAAGPTIARQTIRTI